MTQRPSSLPAAEVSAALSALQGPGRSAGELVIGIALHDLLEENVIRGMAISSDLPPLTCRI